MPPLLVVPVTMASVARPPSVIFPGAWVYPAQDKPVALVEDGIGDLGSAWEVRVLVRVYVVDGMRPGVAG
jgi:hypothetical protein